MGGGIVGKDLLFVLFVGILFVVVFATQHSAPVCGLHFEVIVHEVQVDAVVLQFIFQQHIEFCAVDSLFQRFVGEAIDVVVDHFVDEVPLFEVSLSEGGFDGVVAERIECDGKLSAEGGAVGDARLGAVLHRDGERVGQRSGCTVIGEAHFGVQTVLHLVDFEGMCRLVECALDVFGELSAAHVLDLMIVIYLRSDQCEDRKEHQGGGYPNCPPFHTANIVNFGWSQNLIVYTSCKNSIFYRRIWFDLSFWQVL